MTKLIEHREITPPSSDEEAATNVVEPELQVFQTHTPRARDRIDFGRSGTVALILTPPNSAESKQPARPLKVNEDDFYDCDINTSGDVLRAVKVSQEYFVALQRSGKLSKVDATGSVVKVRVRRSVAADFICNSYDDLYICKLQYYGGLQLINVMGAAKPIHTISLLIV
jgi:hypothetical protein